MALLILGIVVFLGIHSVRMVAPGFRDRMIEQRGEGTWKGIYSVFSLIGFVILIYGYGAARLENVFFYSPPSWMTHVQWLLMVPAMVLLVASQGPVGRIKKAVKNPMLIGVKIWAIGHLLVNGDLASWLLFGTFLVWAVLLVINTNKRGHDFPAETKPIADIIAIVGGIVVWSAFVFGLHEWLFGVPVIA